MKNSIKAIAILALAISAACTIEEQPSCRIVCDYTTEGVVVMRQDIDADVNCESCNNLLQFAASRFACGGSEQGDIPVEIKQAEICEGIN